MIIETVGDNHFSLVHNAICFTLYILVSMCCKETATGTFGEYVLEVEYFSTVYCYWCPIYMDKWVTLLPVNCIVNVAMRAQLPWEPKSKCCLWGPRDDYCCESLGMTAACGDPGVTTAVRVQKWLLLWRSRDNCCCGDPGMVAVVRVQGWLLLWGPRNDYCCEGVEMAATVKVQGWLLLWGSRDGCCCGGPGMLAAVGAHRWLLQWGARDNCWC